MNPREDTFRKRRSVVPLIHGALKHLESIETYLVEFNWRSFPPSWLTVVVVVIEDELLVGRWWRAKGGRHDSVHLPHQHFLFGAKRTQDGLPSQVCSLEGGIEFPENDRVFAKLGFEQCVQNTGGGRGVGFRVVGFGDNSVLLGAKR